MQDRKKKAMVFSDPTLLAMMSTELLRVVSKCEVSVVYGTDYEVTTDFFSSDQYEAYDEVWLIGDVSDEYTNSLIDELSTETRIVGLSDNKNTAEGLEWIRYCNQIEEDGSISMNYFKTMCSILSDIDPKLMMTYKKLFRIINGEDMLGLSKMCAIYYSYDMPSFAQWLQDRLRAIRDNEEEFLGSAEKQLADRLLQYRKNIESAIGSTACTENDAVFLIVLSKDDNTIKEILTNYSDKRKIEVAVLDELQILTMTKGVSGRNVFKFHRDEYTLTSRALVIRKLFYED